MMIGDLADRISNNEMIYPTDFVLEVNMQRGISNRRL